MGDLGPIALLRHPFLSVSTDVPCLDSAEGPKALGPNFGEESSKIRVALHLRQAAFKSDGYPESSAENWVQCARIDARWPPIHRRPHQNPACIVNSGLP